MGWTSYYTNKTFPEAVTEDIESGAYWKVIARSGRYYVAEQGPGNPNKDTPDYPKRMAFVALGKKDRDGQVWTKILSENEGPTDSKCPERLLNMLPPTDVEYANDWRERCRAYHAARKAAPTLKPGDVVKLSEPIRFVNGAIEDTFRFEGGFKFRVVRDDDAQGYRVGMGVRLPRDWKLYYQWEKV